MCYRQLGYSRLTFEVYGLLIVRNQFRAKRWKLCRDREVLKCHEAEAQDSRFRPKL